MTDTPRRHVRVAIIGAGFAGLGVAMRLRRLGITDFVVFERASDIGGTWRDNTYPGAGCDVPSQLYSYSFAPNPDWTHSFSTQPQIQRYVQDTVDREGVREAILLDCEVSDARWNAATARWDIQTSLGAFTADITVSAAGPLSAPRLPEIKGISTFRGALFHSARWDHEVDLTGKRVAVVGTGASAIQIVPSIAGTVGRLAVYQRSAPWVLPRLGHRYTRLERLWYRHVPGSQRLARAGVYWVRESFVLWQSKYPPLADFFAAGARLKLWWVIRDAALRRKVTPDYRLGCKRMLISNEYYPALARENVDVVTDGIREIREHSIVAEDGTEREVDAIVLATGFKISDSPTYDLITGRDGRTLAEVFGEHGLSVYKGTTIANFPNLFLMIGPNAALSYTSALFTIESQINYIVDAITTMDARGLRTVEVRAQAQLDYNRDLQTKFAGTVWNAGDCTSWFVDERGQHSRLWPDFSFRFERMLRTFDVDAYDTTART
ncbi:4-hydroxyacetophenone monooxygenase [Nocardia sp. MH4]|uniref:flavin-containing monooxygenase n=1 Tax=Nocardia sp. MH4 TaxID=1768677 RepID=UPI001C4E3D52|nr:NAD(P)/FAD-dependent oxidoreductase [Nocardia sp. MH4]MBW0273451.1 4-hydroxyacetophenone monooxygenase [Nocardia sp. MH4]